MRVVDDLTVNMVDVGEETGELLEVFRDLAAVGVDILGRWDETTQLDPTERGHLRVVSLLLDVGAIVRVQDAYGKTLSPLATSSGQTDIYLVLVQHRADEHQIIMKEAGTARREQPHHYSSCAYEDGVFTSFPPILRSKRTPTIKDPVVWLAKTTFRRLSDH